MSEDYFKFLSQSAPGVQGKNGVQGANGTQKVNGQGKTNVQKRYQFFSSFNAGAKTGSGSKNVQADNAVKSANKLLSSVTDPKVKNQIEQDIAKVTSLVSSGAQDNKIQDAIQSLKVTTQKVTSKKPAMGL